MMLTREQTTTVLLKNQLPLTAYLATIARSYHVAEDLFQEVCVGAIGRTEPFESDAHVLHWARITGRHRAIDSLRAKAGKYEGLSDDVLDQLATTIHHTSMVQHNRQEYLRDCLQSLSPNNREILRLRYFDGKTSSAIACLLQRKVTTIYQTIARIHKALGECIEQRIAVREGNT